MMSGAAVDTTGVEMGYEMVAMSETGETAMVYWAIDNSGVSAYDQIKNESDALVSMLEGMGYENVNAEITDLSDEEITTVKVAITAEIEGLTFSQGMLVLDAGNGFYVYTAISTFGDLNTIYSENFYVVE